LADSHQQTEALLSWQQTLDANLMRLQETNQAIERGVAAASGEGVVEAIRILAQAVEILSMRFPETPAKRRAA
jgi:hypothetical protein